MPKTIELLPKTFNYTIGINNEENEILIENKEIKGNNYTINIFLVYIFLLSKYIYVKQY